MSCEKNHSLRAEARRQGIWFSLNWERTHQITQDFCAPHPVHVPLWLKKYCVYKNWFWGWQVSVRRQIHKYRTHRKWGLTVFNKISLKSLIWNSHLSMSWLCFVFLALIPVLPSVPLLAVHPPVRLKHHSPLPCMASPAFFTPLFLLTLVKIYQKHECSQKLQGAEKKGHSQYTCICWGSINPKPFYFN